MRGFFLVIGLLFCLISNGQDYRYTERIFTAGYSVTYDVVYAHKRPAIDPIYLNEGDTTHMDLHMDIYEPVGDTLKKRPAIIFAFSGGFLLGHKQHEDIIAFCDSFTTRGYVVASIQYRLGMNPLSGRSATRGVYRGVQDGRSAVRYLRANADLYNIDSSRVYIIGSSAGAFIALHNAFMDESYEVPADAGPYSQVVATTTFPFFLSLIHI